MQGNTEEIRRAYQRAVHEVDQAFDELYAALEVYKAGFNPAQPRVPAGNSDGGQWTAVGGGGMGGQPVSGHFRQRPAQSEKDPDAIEPAYLLESILPGLAPARRLYQAWRAWNHVDAQWTLGAHKSPTKWANRLKKGDWTPEDINDTLRYGKKFPAPNNVSPGNGATRYDYKGRFLVRDNTTKDILQVSRKNFIPKTLD